MRSWLQVLRGIYIDRVLRPWRAHRRCARPGRMKSSSSSRLALASALPMRANWENNACLKPVLPVESGDCFATSLFPLQFVN